MGVRTVAGAPFAGDLVVWHFGGRAGRRGSVGREGTVPRFEFLGWDDRVKAFGKRGKLPKKGKLEGAISPTAAFPALWASAAWGGAALPLLMGGLRR
eukprot:gene15701-5748_t